MGWGGKVPRDGPTRCWFLVQEVVKKFNVKSIFSEATLKRKSSFKEVKKNPFSKKVFRSDLKEDTDRSSRSGQSSGSLTEKTPGGSLIDNVESRVCLLADGAALRPKRRQIKPRRELEYTQHGNTISSFFLMCL